MGITLSRVTTSHNLTPEYRSHVGEDFGMHPYYPITHVIATYVIGFIPPAFLYSGLKLVLLTPVKPERTTTLPNTNC